MTVAIIAAVATNGVIGRNNDLPWHLSADLKRLKALTMGHAMIMGRKTFDSVGRPLPGRTTIVITRDPGFRADGVEVAHSLDEALERAAGDDLVFVAGGTRIFELALHRADRMYITRVHGEPEGDTYFPEFDDVHEWQLVDSEHFEADEKNDYPYSFLVYERVGAAGHPIGENG